MCSLPVFHALILFAQPLQTLLRNHDYLGKKKKKAQQREAELGCSPSDAGAVIRGFRLNDTSRSAPVGSYTEPVTV